MPLEFWMWIAMTPLIIAAITSVAVVAHMIFNNNDPQKEKQKVWYKVRISVPTMSDEYEIEAECLEEAEDRAWNDAVAYVHAEVELIDEEEEEYE